MKYTVTLFFIGIVFSFCNTYAAPDISPKLIKSLPDLPLGAVEELKKFENYPLATGILTTSHNKGDEVGYGVTSDEVEDAIREGIIPKGTRLPNSMSAKEADTWLKQVTIPTYRSIVRKTVTVQLNLEEEAALVFFTQNTGHRNLKNLVSRQDRLNDGNRSSVIRIMPLYYKDKTGKQPGLTKRGSFQVALFKGVFKGGVFTRKT